MTTSARSLLMATACRKRGFFNVVAFGSVILFLLFMTNMLRGIADRLDFTAAVRSSRLPLHSGDRRLAPAVDSPGAAPTTQNTSTAPARDPKTGELEPQLLGMDMRSEALIREVKSRLQPPSDVSSHYSLDDSKKTFFSQNGQDKIIANIFNNKRGGLFLEAGALNGENLSNTLYLERGLGWTGVLVEPNPLSYGRMVNKHRRAHLLQAGLAPTKLSSQINLDLGGKYPALSKLQMEESLDTTKKWAKVACFPLFTVLKALGNPVLDLMSLDIEGLELQVLKTVPWDEVQVRVLMVEVNHVPEGVDAVNKYLSTQNFTVFRGVGVDIIYYNEKFKSDLNLH